ncbi:MAG: histidine kinase [Vicinamibacterales bacterium]
MATNAADVVNLVGFATGTALYALLLVLVLRRRTGGAESLRRSDALPLATALLGLAWNLGEIGTYAAPRLGLALDSPGVVAVAFPALGLLAAVVVHSVARGLRYGPLVIGLGYSLSATAAALHLRTILTNDPAWSTRAFQLLTVSFSLLIVPLAVLTRSQPNGRRALWVLALVLFAVSATHLGSFHTDEDSWWMQVLGHHAAIPLAFAILYQNYRFALGDLFLKHALTLLAVVGLAIAGYSVVAAMPAGPAAVGVLLGLWVATALVTPGVRRLVARFVDAVLLGRADYSVLRTDMAREVADLASTDDVLAAVCTRLTRALSADRVWAETGTTPAAAALSVSRRVTVPTTDAPHPQIVVGTLAAGRRLLSDDEDLLEAVAVIAARRIDAIRLTLERYEMALREEEMQKLAAEAELRALRAQINPHFLFNALTTIGYLVESAPTRAVRTLMRLTRLLRGVLRPEGEFTTLGRELELVEHYLDIERERFEERLRVRIDVPSALRALPIPSLVLQPLVENAIKHGVATSVSGGDVEIAARLDADGRQLHMRVVNTGTPLPADILPKADGLGLENVRRRLAGHYGAHAGLSLLPDDRQRTVAAIHLPVSAPVQEPVEHDEAAASPAGRR